MSSQDGVYGALSSPDRHEIESVYNADRQTLAADRAGQPTSSHREVGASWRTLRAAVASAAALTLLASIAGKPSALSLFPHRDVDLLTTTKESSADSSAAPSYPNIALVYIDDQGYNDMGPHSTDMSDLTPEITRLAADGLWLSQYYGQDVCTPSRAALMTGLYPIHNGMSHLFIVGNAPWGLPLKHTIMPQFLKEVGDAGFAACCPRLSTAIAPQGLCDATCKPH